MTGQPGADLPGAGSPGAASPGGASPGAGSPEGASPGAGSPEGASPGGASPGAGSPEGDGPGEPPCLVVIDMQRVFGEPGSPWLAPRYAEIVDAVRRLAEAFGPRVVFTRFVAPAVPQGAWRQYYDQWPFALQPPDAHIYELADPFAAMAGPTVDATTFSKWGPELAARAGRGPLVLAGVSTDCCVLSTALAAADAGATVRVVADACAGVDDESHAKALHIMSLYGPLVEVVTVADVLGEARSA